VELIQSPILASAIAHHSSPVRSGQLRKTQLTARIVPIILLP